MQEIEGPLNSIQIGEFLTPGTLWLSFALVFGIFAIMSAILLYHWHKYTFDEKVAKKAMVLYFSVSGIFILLLVVSLLSLTL